MKFFIIPLFASMLLGVAPVSAQTQGIAAIVNDDVISMYDLKSRVSLFLATSNQADTPDKRKQLSRQVLNRLIDEKLKMQEARRLDIKVPHKSVEGAFRDMERRNKLPTGGLEKFLASRGVDKRALLDQIEAEVAWSRAVNRSLSYQIQIGDDEIDEIIEEIRSAKGKPETLLAEIFLPVDNPLVENNVLKLADRLIGNLKSGSSFQSIARNYSQSASAAVGGDLGWVRHGQLAKEIDVVLQSLRKGDMSSPIRTVAGYYIILNRARRIGQGLVSEDQKVTLQQAIFPLPVAITEQETTARMEAIRAETAAIKGCKNLEALGKEQGSPLSGSLGEVRINALPDAIGNAIAPLDIGQASSPIPSSDGIMVLMICKRTGPSALDAMHNKIKSQLKNKRLDVAARRRLRDLRNTAFVDIRI